MQIYGNSSDFRMNLGKNNVNYWAIREIQSMRLHINIKVDHSSFSGLIPVASLLASFIS